MGETQRLHRRLEDRAIECVLDQLHEEWRNGRFLFPLADLSEETALNPNTVEAVMRLLERTGPFDVEPVENGYGETRSDTAVGASTMRRYSQQAARMCSLDPCVLV